MKKILITILILISLLPIFSLADAYEDNQYHYSFYLYYDNGSLKTDQDYKYAYDVLPGASVDMNSDIVSSFVGNIYNILGEKSYSISFNPESIAGKEGKVEVQAPYIADATKIEFINSNGQKVLEINVSASSFCNDDKVCDAEVGENYINCPYDCEETSLITPSPTVINEPVEQSGGSFASAIFYILGGIIILGGFVGYKIWSKRKNEQI